MLAVFVAVIVGALVTAGVMDLNARRHGSRVRKAGDIRDSIRDAHRAARVQSSIFYRRSNDV